MQLSQEPIQNDTEEKVRALTLQIDLFAPFSSYQSLVSKEVMKLSKQSAPPHSSPSIQNDQSAEKTKLVEPKVGFYTL